MSARGADLGSDIIGSGSDPEVKLFRKWIRSQRKKNINPGPKWKNYRFKFFSSISWKNVEKVKIFEIFLHCFREAGIFFELQKKLLFLSGPYPPLPPPLNGWATQKKLWFLRLPLLNENNKFESENRIQPLSKTDPDPQLFHAHIRGTKGEWKRKTPFQKKNMEQKCAITCCKRQLVTKRHCTNYSFSTNTIKLKK